MPFDWNVPAYDTTTWGANTNTTAAYVQFFSPQVKQPAYQHPLSVLAVARIELAQARRTSLALPPRALRAQRLPAARYGYRARGHRLRPGMRRLVRV